MEEDSVVRLGVSIDFGSGIKKEIDIYDIIKLINNPYSSKK